ncbi:hypothetical protein D3C78_1492100 [compost metagenome]
MAVSQLWRGAVRALPCGSCTFQAISSQDSTDSAPSRAKLLRQPWRSTSQASGVPVSSMPMPPSPRLTPDTMANCEALKWRAMYTVQTRKAGAQPRPISTWPASSQP